MGRTVDIFAWIWNIGVAVQSIHQLLSENDFETALATVFMAMAPKLLRQFRRSRQIKKTIANAPRKL